ncbi:MAG: CBS domain-containing protein [Alphaproteobacteria bacterium]|nr:CBS domain-containing protein [Alphaproteobacteria bacterium]
MMRTVADIMATRLVTVPPDMNIHEAIRILLDRRISGAPVVDDNGALVGMLSKKDCLKIVFSSQYHDDWGGPVRDFMSAPVETLDADLDLVSAAQAFLNSHFRRFPVVRDGQLVGQVSRYDILKVLTEGP